MISRVRKAIQQSALKRSAAETISAAFSRSIVPWINQYSSHPNAGLPKDISTGTYFTGINRWLVELAAKEKDYRSRWWGSRLAWEEAGTRVKRRETGTVIYPVVEDGTLTRRFVYNAEQVTNGDLYGVQVDSPCRTGYAAIDELVFRLRPTIRFGGTASCYIREKDCIRMPPQHLFIDDKEFYTTLVHEVAHWAMDHPDRLKMRGQSLSVEMIAEMATAILMDTYNCALSNSLRNFYVYKDAWIEKTKMRPSFLFANANAAESVSYWLEQKSLNLLAKNSGS